MSDALDTNAPELTAIEMDIAATRQSLDRKLHEVARRLQPEEVKTEVKEAVKRRLDPEPWLGYIASGMVAIGSVLALRGWRRARQGADRAGSYPPSGPCG